MAGRRRPMSGAIIRKVMTGGRVTLLLVALAALPVGGCGADVAYTRAPDRRVEVRLDEYRVLPERIEVRGALGARSPYVAAHTTVAAFDPPTSPSCSSTRPPGLHEQDEAYGTPTKTLFPAARRPRHDHGRSRSPGKYRLRLHDRQPRQPATRQLEGRREGGASHSVRRRDRRQRSASWRADASEGEPGADQVAAVARRSRCEQRTVSGRRRAPPEVRRARARSFTRCPTPAARGRRRRARRPSSRRSRGARSRARPSAGGLVELADRLGVSAGRARRAPSRRRSTAAARRRTRPRAGSSA